MLIRRIYKLAAILSVPYFTKSLLRFGVAAATEHLPFLASRGFAIVVDVGANRGQFALVAAHSQQHAKILSFEPLKVPAERFSRVFEGEPRVSLQRCALGAAASVAKVHVSHRDDSSSLLEITEEQTRLYPQTFCSGTAQVEIRRLDEVIAAADFSGRALLKIDVQGYELEVLRGAIGVLQYFDVIYVECSFRELYRGQAMAHEVVAFLAEHHFSLREMFNTVHDKSGRAVQADFLFEQTRAA